MSIQYPPPAGTGTGVGTGYAPTALLGPTGVAAFLIGGVTVHTGLGFSVFGSPTDVPSIELVQRLKGRWANVKLVIFDEVSMVGLETLFKLGIHRRLSAITDSSDSQRPFGNRPVPQPDKN
jgi:hypothetical protein